MAVLTRDTMHLDYFELLAASRRLDASSATPRTRVAILSQASTQHLVPLLRVLGARAGFPLEIWAGEFGALETEVLDPESQLYRFGPHFVIVLPAANALAVDYWETAGDRSTFGEERARGIAALWDAVGRQSKATVVQANYVVPIEGVFGSFGLVAAESLRANVLALNAEIARLARGRESVLLCDVDAVASFVGTRTFVDERLWTMAKVFAALEHLPRVAQAIVDVIAAARGRIVKCVVVDLDDTIWGGVIGDDGVEGIRIGHLGDGEAFHRFQQYLRELGRRGIALAVCSKNDLDVAIRPFREHPEMVLCEADIAVFVASWDTKVDNLRTIRERLEIGFDSMVFLDDNPFERNMIRTYLPGVIVPELPEDPSDWIRVLSELDLFETTSLTDEDRARGRLYREEASRKELEKSFTNVDDYLESLRMQVAFAPFDAFHLPRIAQLAQRSNQFNLTTRRESEADCRALMEAGPDIFAVHVRLSDRLGDYGMISVIVGRVEGTALHLSTWLMSCRVLARGVEEYAMNRVFSFARERGLERVIGRYEPTSKNAMVKDFYGRFGFAKIATDPDGSTTWALDVANYDARVHHLKETG